MGKGDSVLNRNVTMKDIAEKLGVSIVSVSKALTGKQGVSEQLRERIKQEAQQMGYHYNLGARALKEGKNYNVGVLVRSYYVEESKNAFYMRMYQSIARRLTHYEYSTMLEVVEGEMQQQKQIPEIVESGRLDGMLVVGELSREYLEALKRTGLPMVYLDFYDMAMGVDSVSMDNVCAEYELTRHLIQKGHKKIAYVGSVEATTSIMDRYIGYRRALFDAGLPFLTEYQIPDRDSQGRFVEPRLPHDMPTAFVCNNDVTAGMVIDELHRHGYRVPEDVAVAGFDNYPYLQHNAGKITTVDVDVEKMAAVGVDLLMERLQHERNGFIRKVVNGTLLYRETTGDMVS
ncbi:MAG: LacI family DNA-binding transcriptional regulator [Lachnospiraceae bacterium]